MGGSLVHLLLTLPKQAWWLIALLAGLSLLSGGGKKKKKKSSDDGLGSVVLIAGAVLLFLGAGGGALKVPAVHHAVNKVIHGSGSCSGLGIVPASMINGAAAYAGLPCSVTYQQINMESGGENKFPDGRPMISSAGALGVAQFEPGTWSDQHCPGSPWNTGDAMYCYAHYMRALMNAEGGSVRYALAAYNAGKGNVGAGLGYADSIMAAAGV